MRRLIPALLGVLCGTGLWSCSGAESTETRAARQLIADNCAACHVVPGVRTARGRVGPSLEDIRHQKVIAGHFVNTPGMLARWIEHPQVLVPGDVMPEMGLTPAQARSIAHYLYTADSE